MFFDELQKQYKEIENISSKITKSLKNFNYGVGWYNDHYHLDSENNWVRENYPIRVVSIINLCDIEVGLFNIVVTSKLNKDKVLKYDLSKLEFLKLKYDIYGVEDYLLDFKKDNLTYVEIKENISKSSEKEIGFSFYLSKQSSMEDINRLIVYLKNEGFYY